MVVDLEVVALAVVLLLSDETVAVAVELVEVDEVVLEEDEGGVVVGRMRMDNGIALLVVVGLIVGDPEAVKIDAMLVVLLVMLTLLKLSVLLGTVEVVVELVSVDRVGIVVVLEVFGIASLVLGDVITELIPDALLGLASDVICDEEEATASVVEDVDACGVEVAAADVEEAGVETPLEDAAATTCNEVFEESAATPGVIAWLTAAVAEVKSRSAVAVLEIGDVVGETEDEEDESDCLVAVPLVSVEVDIVVGNEEAVLEELIAVVMIDDRDKLDVVKEVELFRFAVDVLLLIDADNDGSASIVVYETTVVNEWIVDVASIVSLGFEDIVLNCVEVDMIVVNVVDWLFEEDLGEKVKFRHAERAYKR